MQFKKKTFHGSARGGLWCSVAEVRLQLCWPVQELDACRNVLEIGGVGLQTSVSPA